MKFYMVYTHEELKQQLRKLNKTTRDIMDELLFACQGGGGCLITNEYLLQEFSIKRQELSKYINELIEADLILPRVSYKTRKVRGYYINPWYFWSGNIYSRNKRINLWKHLQDNWVEWNRRHFPKRKHGFPPGRKPAYLKAS